MTMDAATLAQVTEIINKIGKNTDLSGTSSLFAQLGKINEVVNQIEGYTDSLEGLVGTAADILGANTLFGKIRNTESFVSKIGAMSDVAGTNSIFARLAQISGYTDTLKTEVSATKNAVNTTYSELTNTRTDILGRLGSAADEIVANSVFGKLNNIMNLQSANITNEFGTGTDGVFSSTGNITWNPDSNGMVKKNFTSFTLNVGHILTVSGPCKGVIIRVKGNVVINGTIDMNDKGDQTPLNLNGAPWLNKVLIAYSSPVYGLLQLTLQGGQGGAGGGSAGAQGTWVGGLGGPASAFGGGSGGGGAWGGVNGGVPSPGGKGGGLYGGTTGSGNATSGNQGSIGGGGGTIIILASGTMTIGTAGIVRANGSNGSAGGGVSGAYGSGGGGGGGGGIVVAMSKGIYTNSGSITANGGSGGIASINGSAGGAGVISVGMIE